MRALPILIEADGDTTLTLTVGTGAAAQTVTGLLWDEMLGLVAALSHHEIRSTYYGLSKVRAAGAEEPPCVPRPAEPAEPMVTVRIPLAQARRLSEGLLDLLCWSAGFTAACGDDVHRTPYGVEQTRETRRLIRTAIAEATGEEPEPLPF
ncbi:hypothetical protein [Methylobacterium isbiliense]|uniref:Uncharacterized protein n=1 Tax=Methylobacterium isbiliense TaxID=315478 RepID=A0ABQ4SED2_9HYPH|nr:hypothetical protein [Methylobacterium isbiliense]MDN3622562.1 hypothetical protein [Methylobacterium isbiliense]GJE01454.1 hypothetical protein GMJLKIPL_3385 [Methylobacterium isbiliense]